MSTLANSQCAFMSSTIFQEDIAITPSEERPISNKGKERQVHTESHDSYILQTSSETYPPINDDEEETRRVEENLRRWEIAERQRRKAARESSQKSALPSYVDGTPRRVSLLWSGRRSKAPSIGGQGALTALQSQDNIDTLPLRDINISPTPSTSRSSEDSHIADPFANPPEPLSPFSDAHQAKHPQAVPAPYENETSTPVSVRTNPPPPKPLSLPPPRTPPPIATLTLITPSSGDSSEHIPQDKWWHEWLCGCGEGPDRGGDNQAGRTNPFE